MIKKFSLVLVFLLFATPCYAAIDSTNSGFVAVAPVADPDGTAAPVIDRNARACQFTSPAGATLITEIGWWCNNATEEADFEVGVYDYDSGNTKPNILVGKSSAIAKGTDAGWKKATGLNIVITGATTYYLAVQLDNTATATIIDYDGAGPNDTHLKTLATTLTAPWGTSSSSTTNLYAMYAVYTSAAEAAGQVIMIMN